MEYLNLLYNDLTTKGVTHPYWIMALMVVVLISFSIQLHYYLRIYGKLPRFRNNRGIQQEIPSPPVSVVVVVREHSYYFIEHTLPLLLAQQYDLFEVVVVDCSYDDEIGEWLDTERLHQPNLHVTRIKHQPNHIHSIKLALTVGIKAARFEHIVFTTPDSYPVSDKWLSLMAKGFICGDIVIGYCGIERKQGFVNRMIRSSRMITSVRYLSAAIRGKTYRGIAHNIGYTKSLYFGSKGFDHLNMNIGDDDLFIQRIATPDNVSIVMNPNATVRQIQSGGLRWWCDLCKYFGHAYRYYPTRAKWYVSGELYSRFLFFATAGATTLLLPKLLIGIPLFFVVVRLVVVLLKIKRIAARLGEKRLLSTYPLFDLWAPVGGFLMGLSRILRPNHAIWR